jgi:S-adenosylmethionine:tRNA-ribosyltransferase-isomerase (queuine synthetase)
MKRHEWKAAHGFRKFYKSRAEQVMKPINVEITMGHDIGVSACYYKPQTHEVLEDYLKAVDLLTINSDKLVLQKQVLELKEKSKDSEYLIKAKLQEKENQIDALIKKQEQFEVLIQSLIDSGQLKPINIQESIHK